MGLQAGILNHLSWAFNMTDNEYYAASAVASGDAVTGTATFNAPKVGPDKAIYSATPADVLSRRGEAANAFGNFPLT